ncbi:non-canonical purine NTP pyrophosphatase, RdgB/HAM1 family [Halobacteriales archaeon SW_7_68_16]|nr:MAG: non-canonical purine NTP pyrophosphatase, RdgB/HAM1 family [Halobacteriales archaeon SW_7_68_16]
MIAYVTSNPGKAREAREYFEDVEQVDYDYPELQAADPTTIAADGAERAHAELDRPVLVDDAGLFVDGLDGFPGPYSSYVEETIGVEAVWELARDLDDRSAAFRVALAYADGSGVETFTGAVPGRIVAPRGEGGFGFDPIFEHDGRTFAELSVEEKNALSHRGRALAKFADWYASR